MYTQIPVTEHVSKTSIISCTQLTELSKYCIQQVDVSLTTGKYCSHLTKLTFDTEYSRFQNFQSQREKIIVKWILTILLCMQFFHFPSKNPFFFQNLKFLKVTCKIKIFSVQLLAKTRVLQG